MRAAASTALFLAVATPVAALEDILTRPESCAPVLTVQKHECVVETHFLCSGNDSYFRVEKHGVTGLSEVTHIAEDWSWLHYYNADNALRAEAKAADGGQIRQTLIDAGRANLHYKFEADRAGKTSSGTVLGIAATFDSNHKIDGRRVTKTRMNLGVAFADGEGMIPLWSVIYLDPLANTVIAEGFRVAGIETTEDKPREQPAHIIRDGEEGFGTIVPDTDCGDLSFLFPGAGGTRG